MIKNVTNGAVIATEHTLCRSLFSRVRGLMFARKPKTLIMEFPKEQVIGIHMMFVFFPIDVLWLDKDKKVVAMRKNLKPFSLATPLKVARYVIEFPTGTIRKNIVALGNVITWH